MKLVQIIFNLLLYGYLLWYLYRSTIIEWDPWDAFVVVFVLFVALVTTLMPGSPCGQDLTGNLSL